MLFRSAYIMHDDEDDVVLALGIGAEKQFADDWAVRVARELDANHGRRYC